MSDQTIRLSDLAKTDVLTRPVKTFMGTFPLHPLSLDDAAALIYRAREGMSQEDIDKAKDVQGNKQTIVGLLQKFPSIGAHAIALAMKEPGMEDVAKKLPVGVATVLLDNLYEMSAGETEEDEENFWRAVMKRVGSLARRVTAA